MNKAELLAKVADLKAACVDKANADCSAVSGVDCSVTTATAYSFKLDEIEAAIQDYYSDNYRTARERTVHELIMTLYQTVIIGEMSIDSGSLAGLDVTTLPEGYSDITVLFDMKDFYEEFMPTTVSSIWDGCICNPSNVVLPKLDTLVTQATMAEQADAGKRTALINQLKLTNMHNSYIFLFEDVRASNNAAPNQKQRIGEDIFITKNYKTLIQMYNFDIRLPSYI